MKFVYSSNKPSLLFFTNASRWLRRSERKHTYLLITSPMFILFTLISGTIAQNCGSQTITSQSQLTQLAGCTTINGPLILSGVTSLAPMQNITSVGLFQISGTGLTSLKGLESLVTVTDSLLIMNNTNIVSLAGLSALTTINGGLNISNNPALVSFSGGLSSLTTIGSSGITLTNNTQLKSIDAFGSLKSGGNQITLIGMPNVPDLNGFPSVSSNARSTIQSITIEDMTGLQSIAGLAMFASPTTRPGTSVNITNTIALSSLDGLEGLTLVSSFWLQHNAGLTSVQALKNAYITGPTIVIADNGMLCSFTGLDSSLPTRLNAVFNSTCGQPTTVNGQPVYGKNTLNMNKGSTTHASVEFTGLAMILTSIFVMLA